MAEPELPPKPDRFDELLETSPAVKKRTLTLKLRVAGFILIVGAFVLVMALRKGAIASVVIQKIALIGGVLGVLLYFGSRAVEISQSLRKRKRE